ncbi:hypothetical protein HUG17_5237 [Dermatophagoides farinae]|uniref:Uncharacterized protein n=1 Tax=Dermatophagoides farinae TaxID=6954 RepID=A0A9D4P230_DERFA|nr:hypothetical protein HUG17_5237 [Dermatophagoides farinae]
MSIVKDEADNQEHRLEEPLSASSRSQESIQFKFQLPQNASSNREIADNEISNIQQLLQQQKNDSKWSVKTTDDKKNVNIFILPDSDFQMTLRFLKDDTDDKSQKCPVFFEQKEEETEYDEDDDDRSESNQKSSNKSGNKRTRKTKSKKRKSSKTTRRRSRSSISKLKSR